MIEATVHSQPINGSILKATLVMPSFAAALKRLRDDDPIWRKPMRGHGVTTQKPETPWGRIDFKVM